MPLFFPLIYLFLVMGIGIWHRGKIAGEADFFLARRSGGVLLLTGSLIATTMGSFGVMGVAGLGYQMGLTAGWYLWGGVVALILLGGWLIRRFEISDVYTLPELLGVRYGGPVRQVSALLIVLAWLSIVAAQLIAAGKIVAFLGLQAGLEGLVANPVPAIIVISGFFIAYTCLGGQHSILRTDLLQALFIVVSIGALLISVFSRNPDVLLAVDRDFLRMPFNEKMPFSNWLIVLLTFGVPFLVGPDIYSRLFSGRDKETARKAVLLDAALLAPLVLGIVTAGIVGRAMLGEGLDADTVILAVAAKELVPVMAGLLAAAVLAAVMSSADTCLLTISTLVSRDLLDTWLPRKLSQDQIVRRARYIVLIAGVLSTVIAVSLKDIVKALLLCYSIYSPAVLVPFLAMVALPKHRFSIWTGALAVGLGGGVALIGLYIESPGIQLIAFVAPLVPIAIDWQQNRERPAELP